MLREKGRKIEGRIDGEVKPSAPIGLASAPASVGILIDLEIYLRDHGVHTATLFPEFGKIIVPAPTSQIVQKSAAWGEPLSPEIRISFPPMAGVENDDSHRVAT